MVECPDIPNIRHLRMVQMIGKLGGVSCASRELNTSQPAVTQAVTNLEADIGAEIFERCATGTYPTPIGQLFLRRVDRFFEILERAVDEVLGENPEAPSRNHPLVERIITGTQIRSLVVTSDPATVDAAAAQLGVSPSSLYRSVRALERTLGRQLFDRSAHGPVCNRTGAALARQLRVAVREIEFARGEVKLATGKEELEIVVGALPMAGSYELADAVQRFVAGRPNVKVKILTGHYHTLLDELMSCRVDMIFGLLRRPDWAGDEVEEEAMFRDSYCVVARPGHPLAKAAEVTPEEMLKYDWIVPAPGTPRRRQIERLFEGTERKPQFRIETSSLSNSRALLFRGDYITVLTHSEVQFDANLGMIACMPCAQLDALPPKGVTTRIGWLPTEAHGEFLDCLRAVTALTHHSSAEEWPELAAAE